MREGATVRLAGVQIGRVTDVQPAPEPGGKVRVDLTIGRQFANRIRRDSVARIETQGLLGDRIVEITVGDGRRARRPGRRGPRPRAIPPTSPGVVGEGAETMKSVAALAETLRGTAESVNQSKVIQEARGHGGLGHARGGGSGSGASSTASRRGPGLAHALLYEEPVALAPGQRADRDGRERGGPGRAR